MEHSKLAADMSPAGQQCSFICVCVLEGGLEGGGRGILLLVRYF